jgi:lactate dehydrogenase-like 2-hydroxyacid dehydrogenase
MQAGLSGSQFFDQHLDEKFINGCVHLVNSDIRRMHQDRSWKLQQGYFGSVALTSSYDAIGTNSVVPASIGEPVKAKTAGNFPPQSTRNRYHLARPMSQRAFIIGGTGQIGRAVADKLLAKGWDVTVSHRGHRALSDDLIARGKACGA